MTRDSMDNENLNPTREEAYFSRLRKSQEAWWRRILSVQAPYAWNLHRLKPGFMLDVGCGLGRHLIHNGGRGVGIDHNQDSLAFCRKRGLRVFTPEEFQNSAFCEPGTFDSVLFSHVAEHLPSDEFLELLRRYVPLLLKKNGKLIMITPQEAGFRRDPTHREFVDFKKINALIGGLGFRPVKEYSFPLPRIFGRWFYFNEFVSLSRKDPLPV